MKYSLELILNSISAYLRLLESEEYGALAEFAREHDIPNWMLTRLKNRQQQDDYEPKAQAIFTLLRAMLRNPPMTGTKEGALKSVLAQYPGMEEDINLIFQVADILSVWDKLDSNMVNIFRNCIATLHKQAIDYLNI